ncbi:uncharacterized protein BJ212DRAFT_1237613, partial [Suillus subaureus]
IYCLSCSGEHSWCPSCAVKAHQHHPFHNLQLWNGKFYQSTTLWDHRYIIHLGHEGDTIYDTQLGLSNLVIVHSTGVYSHYVSWCQCPGADKDRHLHLLKVRLFPASITHPQSAFTFDVLDHFLIDALKCKTLAMSFYQ